MPRLITLILLSLLCSNALIAQEAQKPLNILFLAVDDLTPRLGCYGDTQIITPNIDKLAANGTVFLNNHCQWAVCGPSRASLMSGLRPETTGVMDLKTKWRESNPDILALPEHFRNNGYITAGAGKIYDPRCVDSKDKCDEASWSLPFAKIPYGEIIKDGKQFAESHDCPDEKLADGQIALSGLKFMKELAAQEKPFFLAVGFKKPHLPFVSPKKYWDLYKRDQIQLNSFQKRAANASDYGWHIGSELRSYKGIPKAGDLSPELQAEVIHGYMASVSYIDAQIGLLLSELEKLGLRENTAIVLWSDHGFHLGDHAMWGKHSNLEQSTRSPLIFSIPNHHKIKSTQAPSELLDIYPTLCEAAGLEIPKNLHGKSLIPILDGSQNSVKNGAISFFKSKGAFGYAYRTEKFRYIEWIKNGEVVARELYDYSKDPQEKINQAVNPEYKSIMTKLAKDLRQEAQDCTILDSVN